MNVPTAQPIPAAAPEPLFSGRRFRALFPDARAVLADHWKPLLALTVVFFIAALALRRFDAGWMAPIKAGTDPEWKLVAQRLSYWGEFHLVPLFVMLAVGLLGWWRRRRAWIYGAVSGVLAGAAAGIVVNVAKVIFGRPRPSTEMADGFYWFEFGSKMASFPSGHSTHSFAMAVGLSMLLPRLWPLTLAGAVAVAWSRYYLDRHYPTDLLMGFWLGTSIGLVFGLAARRGLNAPTPASQPSSPAST